MYKFWKENDLKQEFMMNLDEIKKKYLDFLSRKEKTWIDHYGHQTVHNFIGDDDGLNSVTDHEVTEELIRELKSVRREFLKS